MSETLDTPVRQHQAPLGFVDGVTCPEDLVDLPGTPWIVVSGMRSPRAPGQLYATRATQPSPAVEIVWDPSAETGRVSADVFDPHGIASRALGDGRWELLVVDHGGGEAIDRLVLELRDTGPVVVAGTRHEQPPGTSGNAVAYLPDGGFVMTSMFDPADRETLARFAEAEPTGRVWCWTSAAGWSGIGPLLSGANGIAAAADGSAIFVCEWAARRVWRLDPDGKQIAVVETGFLPDNLRWAPDGRLLLAGQAARPEAVFFCEARGLETPLGFEVVAIDPSTLAIDALIGVDHASATAVGFGGATGALQVGATIWVGSFTGERIAIYAAQARPVRR